MANSIDINKRFWDRVNKTFGCWNWCGSLTKSGYGRIWYDGKTLRAHRLSWQLNCKEPIGNKLVLHKCDNPRCVNPKHLYLGTALENTTDCFSRGRANKCQGEQHGMHKLNGLQVRIIRKAYSFWGKDGLTCISLSQVFNVDKNTIHRIISSKGWNISSQQDFLQEEAAWKKMMR